MRSSPGRAEAMALPNTSINVIRRVLHLSATPQSVSLEAISSSDTLEDMSVSRPDEDLFTAYEIEKIKTLLNAFDSREAIILRLRYGLIDGTPRTLKEIGLQLNLTRERVRQIENQALKKLYNIMTRDDNTEIIRGIREADRIRKKVRSASGKKTNLTKRRTATTTRGSTKISKKDSSKTSSKTKTKKTSAKKKK